DTDGKIFGYTVLEHKETAGLGSKMGDWFQEGGKGNVIGKDLSTPAKVSKDGGDVDAITAATISSRAFCDALNKAYAVYVNTVGSCVSTDTLIIKDDLKCDTLTNVSTIRKTDENSIEVTFKEEGGQDNE
ncbi:MAG: FMN-binding protein, partial [Bacteroidales bacterium]|nr:FMN-binding protein [Bacteroidales bacterium]